MPDAAAKTADAMCSAGRLDASLLGFAGLRWDPTSDNSGRELLCISRPVYSIAAGICC